MGDLPPRVTNIAFFRLQTCSNITFQTTPVGIFSNDKSIQLVKAIFPCFQRIFFFRILFHSGGC